MIRIKTLLPLLLLAGCFKVPTQIEPRMAHTISEAEIQKKNSAFPPLSEHEKSEAWAKEFKIAQYFADQFDLYRAISTYKRAEILLDNTNEMRENQIKYNIVLCYYLAKKYNEVISTFERSDLLHVDPSFPAFCDLLTLLYESYLKVDDQEKATRILALIKKKNPLRARKLAISTAIQKADINKLSQENDPLIQQAIQCYCENKKSPATAGALNAIIPGAGFLYLGQKKSAATAFLLNGLFIAATVKFFQKGYTAAAIITLSFESGWYFGGIYGAKEEAKLYNERLYENIFCPVLNQQKLFPIFMIEHTF